ncbi:MAG: hypothetical protein KC933_04925 [Myxococcales bacterium]|nr:hypothetical protein [Myxococcales bacterium]MCB9649824.1 hypothetical protein [Deltaproteobacteria bacterium]
MKKLLSSLTLALSFAAFSSVALAGDNAIICKSDSTGACKGRQYCCYKGSESDGDKYCKNLGCVRGGTSSCPTAANVSSCGTRDKASELDLPWCIDPAIALDLE